MAIQQELGQREFAKALSFLADSSAGTDAHDAFQQEILGKC